MSSDCDHHAKAERLLAEAGKEQDSARRRLILAEAQVHATLALSAPAGSRPGQDEAGGTESTAVTPSGPPEGSEEFQMRPYGSYGGPERGERRPRLPGWGGSESPETAAEPGSRAAARNANRIRDSEPAPPPGPSWPVPLAEGPPPGKPADIQPEEQEPDPVGLPPEPGNLEEQDPGGPVSI